MDEITRAIDGAIERRFSWLRRFEIAARGVACLAAFCTAGVLIIGLWQPSAERAAQWILALVLLWGAVRLLRSVVNILAEGYDRAATGGQ